MQGCHPNYECSAMLSVIRLDFTGGDSRDGQPQKLLGHNSGEEERPKISRATALAQLERLPQEIPQLFSIFTAKQELRAVLQQNTIFSVEPGLKLLDAL